MRKTWWCTAWATAALLGCTSAREEQARAQRDRARIAARNLERDESKQRERSREVARAQPVDRHRPTPLPARDPGRTRSKVTRRLSKIEHRADQLRTRIEDASPPARARLHDDWSRYSAQHDAAVDRVRRVEDAPEAELATYETEADKHLDALEVSLGHIASKLK